MMTSRSLVPQQSTGKRKIFDFSFFVLGFLRTKIDFFFCDLRFPFLSGFCSFLVISMNNETNQV